MTASDIWPALPHLILSGGIILVLMLGAFGWERHAGSAAILAALGGAAAAIPVPPGAHQLLGLVASPFARFFTILFCSGAALTLFLSHDYNERNRITGEEYAATILFATFGMVVTTSASNLLLLFLGLESFTFAFYILVAMDRTSPRSSESGLKYLLLGAVAAAFNAFAMALIYAGAGTLDTVAAMGNVPATGSRALVMTGWGFLLAGIAFKISLVPLHLWTPDVYEGAPTPVVGFLSTGSKGAAFAALLILLAPVGEVGFLRLPLWWLALLSMLVGNLAALLQANVKRMLAYSSIAQMGYVALALLTGTSEGFAAVALYILFYTAMNLAAFGAISVLCRTPDESIEAFRGMGYRRPFESAVLALAMFSLAGIPPTVGFIGKFAIFLAAIRAGEITLAVLGILTAAASVYFYLRVVVALYMRPMEEATAMGRATPREALVLASTALFIVAFGLFPAPLMDLAAFITS